MVRNERLQEFNQYLKNRKVAILGLDISHLPLISYMNQIGAVVTVFDDRTIEELPRQSSETLGRYQMESFIGKDNLSHLENFDIIFRLPSILPTKEELQAETNRGAIVTSEIEMFMEMCPCKMIGVTGSDGKTTTATMISEILKAGEYRCHLIDNSKGNLFNKLSEIEENDICILELSSLQLMEMNVSPDIAVVTNISQDNPKEFSDFDEYINAKRRIFREQNEQGILILNYDNEYARRFAHEAIGKVIFFSSKEKLDNGIIVDNGIIKECEDRLRKHILNTKDTLLKGLHSYENMCAALAVAKYFVPVEVSKKAICDFKGVEHSLEFVREINGVKWYNDASSSFPIRTVTSLKSFEEDVILIAGGRDQNLDYTCMAKPIVDKVSSLILIGGTSDKIFDIAKEELENQNKSIPIYVCDEFSQVVAIAHRIAKQGQSILFSPASKRFDKFDSYAEIGNRFKQLVNEIDD